MKLVEKDLMPEPSGREIIPAAWWQSTAGIKVVTLKPGRKYAAEVLPLAVDSLRKALLNIRQSGFNAIEVFAPAAGGYAYSGLDTKDHYGIDPELGTIKDFERLVRLSHHAGLAVTAFLNVGYYSLEAPDWLEACAIKRSGGSGGKADWFLWAEDASVPPPCLGDTYFPVFKQPNSVREEKPETWGWQYSRQAGAYYWARWEAKNDLGDVIGLPQNNWLSSAWREEAERILRFWMATGLDGLVVDAPLYYPGLDWRAWNRHIRSVAESFPNTMLQAEGGAGLGWVTEGGCNCVQNYFLKAKLNDTSSDLAYLEALKSGNPCILEESLRYHDKIVAAGAVLYHGLHHFEPNLQKRHLIWATLTSMGEIIALTKNGSGQQPSPDAEESWILRTKHSHPALHNLAMRNKLDSSAEDKVYALLKLARTGEERMLVALNYTPNDVDVTIDLSGVAGTVLRDLRDNSEIPRQSFVKLSLPPYGYRFYDIR